MLARAILWMLCAAALQYCKDDEQPANAAPVAEFTMSVAMPKEEESITFTDTSQDADGEIVSWVWNFGDGATATEPQAEHTYTIAGTYTVALMVKDDRGATDKLEKELTVINPAAGNVPPVAAFNASSTTLQAGEEIVFTDASIDADGTITTWTWSFGDGATSAEQHPHHTYLLPGEYTVTLTVTDNLGATGQTNTIYATWGQAWAFAMADNEEIRSPSPALADDGTVYIGSDDDLVYAINPDGSLKWAFQAVADVDVSPAIGPDGTVYVGSQASADSGGKLYALNPADGALLWAYTMGAGDPDDMFYSSPAFGADGTIYAASRNHTLYAFSNAGAIKWEVETSTAIRGTPVVGTDGTVFVVNDNGDMYAVNNTNGTIRWQVNLAAGARDEGGMAIGEDGTLYVGTGGNDDKLRAISPTDGHTLWSYQAGADVLAAPVVGAGGVIYVGARDGKFYAINPDGSLQWEKALSTTDGEFRGAAAIGEDGTIFIGHYGGDKPGMYALSPADGAVKQYFACDRVWSSPAIKDDIVYFGSFDGNLYAVNMGAGNLANTPWPMRGKNLKHTGRTE